MREGKQQSNPRNGQNAGKKSHYVPVLLLFGVIFLATLIGILFYRQKRMEYTSILSEKEYEVYDYYFVMIVDDPEASFWNSVYESALQKAKESGAYLEMPGKTLVKSYSKQEQIRIAIEAGVDGIILEADNLSSTAEMINEAEDKGIPVITVLEDSKDSKRQSYVGISNYHIGREYGRVVARCLQDNKRNVTVFMDAEADANVQSMLITGIQEGISEESSGGKNVLQYYSEEVPSSLSNGLQNSENPAANISISPINEKGAFAAEELIRDVFLEEEVLPDIIICMDEMTTNCVYQMVVDYNKVGDIDIIGYYNSDTILKAIERDVISATITIDSAFMGQCCMNALLEYITTGHVSAYFSVDIDVIEKSNLEEFQKG